jgi:hypothetical protein
VDVIVDVDDPEPAVHGYVHVHERSFTPAWGA